MPIHTIVALMVCIGMSPVQTTPRSETPMTTLLAEPDSTTRFPRVEGTNLEGRRFVMPIDFEGRLNVILIAFKREQQSDVDSWMPFLREFSADRDEVRVYELPVLNRNYRLMRRVIDGGMARGIPDRATRAATITMYIDKQPFKTELGISSEEQITVLLVTRDGRVLWRANGAYSPALAQPLSHIKDVSIELFNSDFLLSNAHRHQVPDRH